MAQGAGEQAARATHHEEEMPRVVITRRQAIAFGVFVLTVVGFLYFVLPKLAGVGTTLHHLEHGDGWWIAFGVVLELLSFAGYVVLFRAVFVTTKTGSSSAPGTSGSSGSIDSSGSIGPHDSLDPAGSPPAHDSTGSASLPTSGPIGWSESYQITMAGLAATRLFATAGAGGVALTAWALRRSGMAPRLVACRMVAFMVLLYAVYAGSVLIDGLGLGTGLFPGGGSFALTIVPAIVAAILMTVVGAMALLPGDIERRLHRWASGSGRLAHWVARAVTVPALAASGVRTAIELLRERDPGLLGAVAWWGFDICVLWAMFHAFGSPGGAVPPFTVIWMSYFIGMLGNLLPLPGGLGGVEGGMIGALAAFGVNLDLAVLAVLSYRAISFWLPTVPGAIAYFQLRRTVARWREQQQSEHPAAASSAEDAAAVEAAGALRA
jgi:putative heme transporter